MNQKLWTTLVLAALVVSAILLPFAEMKKSSAPDSIAKALFFPSKYPIGDWTPDGLMFKDVHFYSADGTKLHGWYCPAKEPRGVMLFAHGNAGNVASRARLLRHLQTQTNVSVFIFDYRGFGRSEGTPSIDGALQDAQAAREKLRQLASITDSKMLLMGESLGGAIVVQLAAENGAHALILQSTFSSLQDLAKVHYPQFASLVSPDTLDSASSIKKYKGPVYQSHGEGDKTIPLRIGKRLFQAANEPKQFIAIPNADHNNWMTSEYLVELDSFINNVAAVNEAEEL